MKSKLKNTQLEDYSPWLDPNKKNLFKDEFQFAKENLPYINFRPFQPYIWIHKNNGEELFFKGLAKFAPMFPIYAYRNQIAVWISPPPSGLGNTIYIVMGHDCVGNLRLIGGNYFTDPEIEIKKKEKNTIDFFSQIDLLDESEQKNSLSKL